MQIKLLVDGGEMKPGPALSQKMGPLGINLGKVISEVNKATAAFKGVKVPIILDINTKAKDFTLKVLTPPTAGLLKKEFGLEKGSQMPNKIKMANIPIEKVIKIAKIKEQNMLVNDLKAAVNSVLGSCHSIGILVEGKNAREVIAEVKEGKYDKEIKEGREEASEEKIKKLDDDFNKIKKAQDAFVKELEAKKEAAPAAAAAGAAAPGAAAPAAAAPAKEEKKAGKKK